MLGLRLGLGFCTIVPSSPDVPPTLTSATLLAWYRGDRGITLTSGNVVSQWNDLSGNGYNATAASGHQPVYTANTGRGYVVNISSSALVASGMPTEAQPYEQFIACRPTSATPAATGYIVGCSAGSKNEIKQNVTTGDVANIYFAGGQLTAADHIVDAVHHGASSSLDIDGGTAMTGSVGSESITSGYVIGNTFGSISGFVGRIYEVIVYSGTLSSGDRATLITYLKGRYGIA